MGCDIHLHVEIKVGDKWRHYNHPNIKRDYSLFAKMAGVRNWKDSGIEPLSKPRGLPRDMSFTTEYDSLQWLGDNHSDSYLNADEIGELFKWGYEEEGLSYYWLEDRCGFLFGNSFAEFSKYPENYPIKDVRFVFWFDN